MSNILNHAITTKKSAEYWGRRVARDSGQLGIRDRIIDGY